MRAPRWQAAALLAILALFASAIPAASAGEPSEQYKAELKRTLELKRQRRGAARVPVGVIEMYPIPPALIIRQTRENHDEIGALLNLLRYGGR
jgi:hypothetical protein